MIGGVESRLAANYSAAGVDTKEFDKIRLLKNSPHIDALNWRWEATQKEWKTE
jgi:hypothetical protein